MRPALLLVLLVIAAASPAAAQSCATLGGGLDCGAAPGRPAAKAPRPPLPGQAGQATQSHGHAETTVSNHGASMTLDNRTIDSHGLVEFGFRGSTRTPCRVPGYGAACD